MDSADRKLLLSWSLRLFGLVEILAFIAVIMPRSWMQASHAWLGLGEMPHGSVLMFLIRQASYSYGMHGVSLWIIATGVERFRALIVFNGIAYLLAAPVFFTIDYLSGMPMWWAIGDSMACGLVGATLLWGQHGLRNADSQLRNS
jgi:hypothetical protein